MFLSFFGFIHFDPHAHGPKVCLCSCRLNMWGHVHLDPKRQVAPGYRGFASLPDHSFAQRNEQGMFLWPQATKPSMNNQKHYQITIIHFNYFISQNAHHHQQETLKKQLKGNQINTRQNHQRRQTQKLWPLASKNTSPKGCLCKPRGIKISLCPCFLPPMVVLPLSDFGAAPWGGEG